MNLIHKTRDPKHVSSESYLPTKGVKNIKREECMIIRYSVNFFTFVPVSYPKLGVHYRTGKTQSVRYYFYDVQVHVFWKIVINF